MDRRFLSLSRDITYWLTVGNLKKKLLYFSIFAISKSGFNLMFLFFLKQRAKYGFTHADVVKL